MFGLSDKPQQPNEKVKRRLLNRLRNTSNVELMRWLENVHTGIQADIVEVHNTMSRGNNEHALVYLEDIRTGAVSILAVVQAMEERCSTNQ